MKPNWRIRMKNNAVIEKNEFWLEHSRDVLIFTEKYRATVKQLMSTVLNRDLVCTSKVLVELSLNVLATIDTTALVENKQAIEACYENSSFFCEELVTAMKKFIDEQQMARTAYSINALKHLVRDLQNKSEPTINEWEAVLFYNVQNVLLNFQLNSEGLTNCEKEIAQGVRNIKSYFSREAHNRIIECVLLDSNILVRSICQQTGEDMGSIMFEGFNSNEGYENITRFLDDHSELEEGVQVL